MPLRFAINGFGRVGRALLRAAAARPAIELAAVNDVVPAPVLARLLARDTVHGPYPGEVRSDDLADLNDLNGGALVIDGRRIPVFQEPDPARVPWEGVEAVVEATGRFIRRDLAAGHLRNGVRTVIVSANAEGVDATVCLGLNEGDFDPDRHTVISNASCTTNCLALMAKVLHDAFGVRRALMSTVHSYTENQRLLDLPHPDPRRSRAAALNIIPTSTTAAHAVGLVLPALAGRIDGFAVRVPTAAVAMLDLVAELDLDAPAEAVRQAFRAAAEGPLAGVLGVTDEELVSSDFVNDPRSAVIDLPLVQSLGDKEGRLVRVVAWYDNEWGYAHRLADLLEIVARHAAPSI
ncbi:MAG TPA: glyceraldehyde 3-phosphate dehydrogenase NAD-binding domain-containing protein [Thermoanaerobaculia bacterium]|nr:glyceraldehyde 3-phosphate dehydrogenase NAD-binding domain-containing protein [Thermoanaerobaculia bacterium]